MNSIMHPVDFLYSRQELEILARWLAEGVELKDVVRLAFHEFFERRDCLSKESSL